MTINSQLLVSRRTFIASGSFGLVGCVRRQRLEPQPKKARSSKVGVSRIVDAHVHFFDLDFEVNSPNDKDKLLWRSALLSDYLKTVGAYGAREAILIEASSRIENNQCLLDLAKENRSILGFVGNLPVGDFEFRGHLELFTKSPLFLGIRLREKDMSDLSRVSFVADLRHIAVHGLSLDVVGGPTMLPNIVKLTDAIPTLRIIINHFPFDVSTDSFVRNAAERAMDNLSTRPNVFVKISNILRKLAPEFQQLATYRSQLDHLWKTFGPNRLLYGSNWPVSDRVAPHSMAIDILKEYLAEMPSEQSEKFFWRNSRVAYDWKERG